MKVKPNYRHIDEEDWEDLYIYRPSPINSDARERAENYAAREELFYNDCFDDDIDTETRKSNAMLRFDEKIPLDIYDLLSDEEKIAYHQFLLDYSNEHQTAQ